MDKLKNIIVDKHLHHLIQDVYTNSSLTVKCNNQELLADAKHIHRGVQQGCIMGLPCSIYS